MRPVRASAPPAIANGTDKVNVTGVDGKPQTGEITHDGYEWRSAPGEQEGPRDLPSGRRQGNVQWFKEKTVRTR